MINRIQSFDNLGRESAFLWGPRQTGKSTLLKSLFPHAPHYDLLLSSEYQRLVQNPAVLREELRANPPGQSPIIIDEIQKIPELLDEIQWMIVNLGYQFIMCGSSPRRLRRGGGNLLGGRAFHYELFPFVSVELPDFDLFRALNHGMLPRHYLGSSPEMMVRAYVGDYLREEIAAEAATRNVPAFSRFLESAAFSNGEMVNYENIARECGVSSPTVKAYYQVLVDTLLGRFVEVYQRRPKRRVIKAPKFYFFDLAIVNFLLRRGKILPGSEILGRVFERFIYQELIAHSHYSGMGYPIHFWRTASRLEVDFVIGEREPIAIEVKSCTVQQRHIKGLLCFKEEYPKARLLLVSFDARPRKIGSVSVLPWRDFLENLWSGRLH